MLFSAKGYMISCSGTVISSCNVKVFPCPGIQTVCVFFNTVDTKNYGIYEWSKPLENQSYYFGGNIWTEYFWSHNQLIVDYHCWLENPKG